MVRTSLRVETVLLLWLFGLQFLAGMVLNLFIELPKTHPGAGGEYFTSSWASLVWSLGGGAGLTLLVHAWLAVLLVIGTALHFLHSLASGEHLGRWSSGIAAFFTVAALFNGLSFADYGEDFSSLIMASCWLIAVALLVFSLTRTRAKTESTLPQSRHHE